MRKFAREYIEKYPSIARLNESIAGPRRMGSEGSVEAYVKGVRKFLEYVGESDPETALERLKTGSINAAGKVDEFIDVALKKYAHGTVRNFLFGVKKWFSLNGVGVDWRKIEFPTSTETSESDRAPSKEEIKRLLNHASGARDRAAILILASSGLRVGTMLSLKVGNLNLKYPDVASLKVERQRGRKFGGRAGRGQAKVFFTFLTGEAKDVLVKYLEERKRKGERLTEESPLIGDSYYKGRFLTVLDFERVYYRLLKRAGLADKSQKWYQLHLHTLRKYFRSNCVGVDPSYREHWMGHKGGYLDESYFRAEEGRHLAEYRKAVPHLTVYSTPMEEKQLRGRMLIDFAKLQGYGENELKRLEEVLARAKSVDDALTEFKRFKEEPKSKPFKKEEEKPKPQRKTKTAYDGNGRYLVAHGEEEMIQRLHDGWTLRQGLNNEKYLLEKA